MKHAKSAALAAATCIVILAVAGAPSAADDDDWKKGYPEHWWKPAPTEGAPKWEILPQAAKPGEVILSKRNELGILSNFTKAPFTFHGEHYESLEGFWQCMKFPEGPDDERSKHEGLTWTHTRADVRKMVAFDAHSAGREAEKNMKAMGIDWITFEGEKIRYKDGAEGSARHYELIVAASWAKLQQNEEVRKVLMSTGDLVLKPDHHQNADDPKAWRYYDIWMMIRDELKAGKTGPEPQK